MRKMQESDANSIHKIGRNINHQRFICPKHREISSDVVEDLYNAASKCNGTGIFNKHSKSIQGANRLKRHLIKTANRGCQSHNETNQQDDDHLQTLNRHCNPRKTLKNTEEHKSKKHSNKLSIRCKTQQYECITLSRSNDSMLIRSYEMPTLASKLKCSNRSYPNKINSRNIPFVVGTSVAQSHNLGINVQQVLSLIKIKQSNVDDTTMLLIRQISKGTKPASILLKQMNEQCEKLVHNVNSQIIRTFNNKKCQNIKQDKLFADKIQSFHTLNFNNSELISERNNKIYEQIYKEKANFHENNKIKQQFSVMANENNPPANTENVQIQISRILLNKEKNIDGIMYIAYSHNFKEIRNVLINLHDEFEGMNMKYEKLQLEAQKSDNKILAKELLILEKELNIKEEEINTVVGNYKQVMMLKQQMAPMRKENNLICIATELSTKYHQNSYPISVISGKSHLMNMTQVFGRKEENAYSTIIRKPPISTQLAALLRQIQAFYKQLQLIS